MYIRTNLNFFILVFFFGGGGGTMAPLCPSVGSSLILAFITLSCGNGHVWRLGVPNKLVRNFVR